MNKKDFTYYVTKFFSDYLPNHTGYSENTIESYKYTFIQFIEYCNRCKNIKSNNITFEKISSDLVKDFLLYLEKDKNSKTSTRNQKLAAIKSFFKFVQSSTIEFTALCSNIRDIPMKKYIKADIEYLTVNAIEILLKQIDSNKELRDLTILSLLYDSGARVQEIADLKACNIFLEGKPKVYLTGKGNKTRCIPINKEVGKILKKYTKVYDINTKTDVYLFKNKYGSQFTRKGIAYILDKYVLRAKIENKELFNIPITPHVLRNPNF